MKEVLCDELKAIAAAYGFKVVECKTLFPRQVDDFVASPRIAVDMVVVRDGVSYYFGDSMYVHPAVSIDQFMSSEIWRYTLVAPVQRQMWEIVTHEN